MLSQTSTSARLRVDLPEVTNYDLADQLQQTVMSIIKGDFSSKREAIEVTFTLQKMEFICPEALVTSAYGRGCGGLFSLCTL